MNNKFIILISLSLFIVTLFSCGSEVPQKNSDDKEATEKVVYKESDEIITNPERGFYGYNSFSSIDNNILTVEQTKSSRKAGRTLMLNIYYLYDFRDKPISQEFLDRIDKNMKALRDGGVKCVLRFAYSDNEDNKPWDAPLDIVLQHVEQLKPYLIENADVIYTMEAGFVGVWGEWYYTDNFNMNPKTPQDYMPRKRLLEALLNSLPKERMLNVRTPSFKLNTFGINYSDTISIAKAFDGSILSRIGSHNDCFLASSNDYGTFNNNQERQFWENESRYTVMGGETCGTSNYSTCNNAVLMMEKFHWSYLNHDYHPAVLSGWKTSGCFNEISKRLGYRFVLTEGEFTKDPVAGNDFQSIIKIKNIGFASPTNPRNVELVFVAEDNADEIYKIAIGDDPRKWFPNGEYTINVKYMLPVNMKGKKYIVNLHLPDPKPSLVNLPEYSIQLANEQIWDNVTGYNKIHTIYVK